MVRGGNSSKERKMIYLKRIRTAKELMQFINGTSEDEDYFFEITDALFNLKLKEFFKNREEDMIRHFRKKVPEHIKDKDNKAFMQMCFGNALLEADSAGEIKGDCLATFFLLMQGSDIKE